MKRPANNPITTRVSGPRGLLAAVPYILGFHPSKSVVVMSLQGEKQRIGLTTRLERSNFDESRARGTADYLAALVVRDSGSSAVVIEYSDDGATGRDGGLVVHDAFSAAFTAAEIDFYDCLHVAGGRFWSMLCVDSECRDHSGDLAEISSENASDFAFAATLDGVAPLPSREALVASLRPAHPIARATLAQAVDRHTVLRIADRLQATDRDAYLSGARARTLRLAQSAAASGEDGAINVSTEEMAELLTGLADLTARDMCIEWSARDKTRSAVRLWTHLARVAPEPLDAAPLTLLAWCAYREGNGALARIALDRALRSDPEYGMAQILSDGLDGAVEPRVLRQIERELPSLLSSPSALLASEVSTMSARASRLRRGVRRRRRREDR